MVCFIQGAFMLHLLTLLSFNIAHAHIGGTHDWPQHREDIEDIAYWAQDDGWYVPILETEYGTRVGLFIEKSSLISILKQGGFQD